MWKLSVEWRAQSESTHSAIGLSLKIPIQITFTWCVALEKVPGILLRREQNWAQRAWYTVLNKILGTANSLVLQVFNMVDRKHVRVHYSNFEFLDLLLCQAWTVHNKHPIQSQYNPIQCNLYWKGRHKDCSCKNRHFSFRPSNSTQKMTKIDGLCVSNWHFLIIW